MTDHAGEVWDPFGTLSRTFYHYGYHDARAHNDRLAGFPIRFEWALDDLRALVSGRPIIAEGWGLRPELVAPIIDSPRRMIVMVATEKFRQHQLRELPRAAAFAHHVSDPTRAQHNRLARDRLVADHFTPYVPPPEHHMT